MIKINISQILSKVINNNNTLPPFSLHNHCVLGLGQRNSLTNPLYRTPSLRLCCQTEKQKIKYESYENYTLLTKLLFTGKENKPRLKGFSVAKLDRKRHLSQNKIE